MAIYASGDSASAVCLNFQEATFEKQAVVFSNASRVTFSFFYCFVFGSHRRSPKLFGHSATKLAQARRRVLSFKRLFVPQRLY